MSRGLTRLEAMATIVRGFLRVDIEGLPPMLNAELKKAVEASEKDLMKATIETSAVSGPP
jgi:uncharacterized protein